VVCCQLLCEKSYWHGSLSFKQQMSTTFPWWLISRPHSLKVIPVFLSGLDNICGPKICPSSWIMTKNW
jgi:hypothetical protein